ncbi:MAG: VOC family protein [Anaerolineae bacterium]|nr:VOC family protein [Anaerolineae bacterium]
MSAAFQFDHAIVAVADLDAATADFRALGFQAFYGGRHADGKTHNALVVFAGGGYLELLAPTDVNFLANKDTVDLSSFLDFVARGDGWAGYALLVQDIDRAAEAMRARRLKVTGPTANGRKRPDGEQIAWRTLAVDNSRTPFFITDETPRVLRVPDDADKITHDNGVTAVDSLVVAVQKLDKGVAHYQAMLGLEPGPGPHIPSAETASFRLGDFTLVLAAPGDYDSPLYGYLRDRGEAPFEIRLRTTQPEHEGLCSLKQSHGARIALIGP